MVSALGSLLVSTNDLTGSGGNFCLCWVFGAVFF